MDEAVQAMASNQHSPMRVDSQEAQVAGFVGPEPGGRGKRQMREERVPNEKTR